MAGPPVEMREDHVLVRIEGVPRLTTLRGSFSIPYSTIRKVDVEPPRWPGVLDHWRVGVHWPHGIARGTFTSWKGHRRFLWFDKKADRVLTIALEGHPDFDEVSIEMDDPEPVREEIERRKKSGA